jgi:hypothetical protein
MANARAESLGYLFDIPDEDYVREALTFQVNAWSGRNQAIAKVRQYIRGDNGISVPTTRAYDAKATHTFFLLAILNEKLARYSDRPQMQILPRSEDTEDTSAANQMEAAANAVNYWMDRKAAHSSWIQAVADTILFSEGVERMEYAPAAFWPELALTKEGKENLSFTRPFEDPETYAAYREEYKKKAGVPMRSVYVPLESFFPEREGGVSTEVLQVERRSLHSVLTNKMFRTEGLQQIKGGIDLKNYQSMRQMVSIIHYSNANVHAYFALAPESSELNRTGASGTDGSREGFWPDPMSRTPGPASSGTPAFRTGHPIFLHAYETKLGRPNFNSIPGRFGVWGAQGSQQEWLIEGLTELVQRADEISSQVLTNVRATSWPTYAVYLDPEFRDTTGDTPEPPTIIEGKPIAFWKTERMEQTVQNDPSPATQWYFQMLTEQIERLSGSEAVFGQRQPGVTTGYHQNLQVTQAEHLDARVEAGIVHGAISRQEMLFDFARINGEKIHVYDRVPSPSGRTEGNWVVLDPKELDPMPQLDARVTKPRPIDYSVQIRAALDATMNRNGPNTPLLDDATVLETILGEERAATIERRKYVQAMKQKAIESGLIDKNVQRKLNMMLAEDSAAQPPTPGEAAEIDPELMQAMMAQNQSGDAAAMGGVDPAMMAAQVEGAAQQPGGAPGTVPLPPGTAPSPYQGRGGGLPPGAPQPEQADARAIAAAARALS